MQYRVYMSDILRAFMKAYGGDCERYIDIISGEQPQDANTPEKIRERALMEFERLRGEK